MHYANRLICNVLCNDTFKTTCRPMSNVYLFLSVLLLYVLCRPMSENSSAELMFKFIDLNKASYILYLVSSCITVSNDSVTSQSMKR